MRYLRRRLGFAALAVLTIALGIGATTAMFSVVDGVLLRPLPYRAPGELVRVFRTYPHWRTDPILKTAWENISFSYPGYREWRDAQTSFAEVGAWRWTRLTLSAPDHLESLEVVYASPSLLPMLGLHLAIGRGFLPGEEGQGAAPVALISHDAWMARFAGRPDIVGQSLTLDERAYTIIGVLPAGFDITDRGNAPPVWLPGGLSTNDRPNNNSYNVVARIKPGITLERAFAETERIVRGTENPTQLGVRLAPWQLETTKRVRAPLYLLLGAAGLLLALACANVATLLLGEASSREHEMATRLALGAGRWRILRQLLQESVVLSMTGAVIGVALAFVATRLLVAAAPQGIPRLSEVGTDLRVLGFALVVATGTGMLFGLAPAVFLANTSPGALLRGGGRQTARGRAAVQRALVAAEVAICLVLLLGAGLLGRSLQRLSAVNPGFDPDRLTVVSATLAGSRFTTGEGQGAASLDVMQRALARVAAVSGVERVSGGYGVPFSRAMGSNSLRVEGYTPPEGTKGPEARRIVAMPGFVETMRIPLLAGRTFANGDRAGTAQTVLVSESMARRWWPNESAIGKRLSYDGDTWATIVGIVGDVRQRSLEEDGLPTYYIPFMQEPARLIQLVVRARAGVDVLPGVRAALVATDPAVTITGADPLSKLVRDTFAEQRYRTTLVTMFSALAALLAAIGIYGVTARLVAQQRREIGIRVALGGQVGRVARLYLGRTTIGIAAGLVAGLVLARLASRVVTPFLFQTAATDLGTWAGIVALLAAIALTAGWVPARRAAAADPGIVLRDESQ